MLRYINNPTPFPKYLKIFHLQMVFFLSVVDFFVVVGGGGKGWG